MGEGRLLKLCENEETAGLCELSFGERYTPYGVSPQVVLRSKPGFVELLEHSV